MPLGLKGSKQAQHPKAPQPFMQHTPPCASQLQVLSVDACQGDEADAVMVSTVRNVFGTNQNLSRCGWV